MVNFVKLKRLISEYEDRRDTEKREFFIHLKAIAEEEIRLKQESLLNF